MRPGVVIVGDANLDREMAADEVCAKLADHEKAEEAFRRWLLTAHRQFLNAIYQHGDFRLMDEETRGLYERHHRELRGSLTSAEEECETPGGSESGRPLQRKKRERLPTVEEMAEKVKLAFA